ncbi:MAG: HAD-IA family hydrolase [Clostridiales bacterium]|nr:HAD-IA family hydrolase [Clostridiales bacterium]
MAKTNTVLFDFDGTVMDTNSVIIGSWQHTFRTIEGKERPVADIVKTFGEPLDHTMAKLFPHMDPGEAVAIYRSFHYNNFGDMIKLFPGMRELLEALKARGYKLGLVTSRLKKTTMEGLEQYRIKEYFDAVVTCEDTARHKPDPEPVNITLGKLGSKPEESIMLGDTMYDILCAKNAGVKSVLVGWSLAVQEEEKAEGSAPDYIIKTAGELLDILSRE